MRMRQGQYTYLTDIRACIFSAHVDILVFFSFFTVHTRSAQAERRATVEKGKR